jgi:hypothetical protein
VRNAKKAEDDKKSQEHVNVKGGRVLTVVRNAKKAEDDRKSQEHVKVNVRILCVPPKLPLLCATAVGDEKSQGFDISLLYRLIL